VKVSNSRCDLLINNGILLLLYSLFMFQVDLADEHLIPKRIEVAKFSKGYISSPHVKEETDASAGDGLLVHNKKVDPIVSIRSNLPPDPLLSTPFGTRRMTYADYTASGRSLKFIEEFLNRVIAPMYANTHTETSASGLQTTHAREEARMIIMKSLHASPEHCALIFTGTGVTGAIWKLIALLGIHCPVQLLPYLDMKKVKKPLILISHSEHHSNELMWRETIADVMPIPPDSTGALDLEFMRGILEENKEKYETIIGSFTAGSNVTGLLTPPGPVASILHEYGGYACFDYAGAGPYVEMSMEPSIPGDDKSYLDAIYISPHKFVGGPGTPGLLCVRKEFADCRGGVKKAPPTIAGGGTGMWAPAKFVNRWIGSMIDTHPSFFYWSSRCQLKWYGRPMWTM
jgi:selenocysteine lyase/cysteine desulfurase